MSPHKNIFSYNTLNKNLESFVKHKWQNPPLQYSMGHLYELLVVFTIMSLPLLVFHLICLSMMSYARFRPVFKASRPKVLAPLFNKGTADLNGLTKILPSPCPL
jgi:hypothetical protein